LDRLIDLRSEPVGTVKYPPSVERSLVTRNVTFSTCPGVCRRPHDGELDKSPNPYCFSTMMKEPREQILDQLLAPKPSAAQITVAGATSPFTETSEYRPSGRRQPMRMRTLTPRRINRRPRLRCLVPPNAPAHHSRRTPVEGLAHLCAAQVTKRAASTVPNSKQDDMQSAGPAPIAEPASQTSRHGCAVATVKDSYQSSSFLLRHRIPASRNPSMSPSRTAAGFPPRNPSRSLTIYTDAVRRTDLVTRSSAVPLARERSF